MLAHVHIYNLRTIIILATLHTMCSQNICVIFITATSRKEYTIDGDTNKDDVYSEDNRLNVNLPVVFQIKVRSYCYTGI
jgi:hypothetical protein